MRISDWSSDVCSSDLRPFRYSTVPGRKSVSGAWGNVNAAARGYMAIKQSLFGGGDQHLIGLDISSSSVKLLELTRKGERFHVERSEEHTSELQSLMRISYAVFCLKKKTQLLILP